MADSTIAIQGVEGSFHEWAAQKYFQQSAVEILPCDSFRAACNSLSLSEADFAVMAIENTIYGSILTNYSLIDEYDLRILGEVYLPIEQHLMALPGTRLEEISTAQSHPIALQQCAVFFDRNPQIQRVEKKDTASCAQEIADQQLWGVAAVGGEQAAQRYGLEIVARAIQTYQLNSTRFLCLTDRHDLQVEDPDKASISFQLKDEPGYLAEVLRIFAENNINLTKIQSVPLPERPFLYSFHVDMLWERPLDFVQAIEGVQGLNNHLKIYGQYHRGQKAHASADLPA